MLTRPLSFSSIFANNFVSFFFAQAHIYYKSSNDCAAFLANYDSSSDANVTFNGNVYFLPAWSVSILPDCKNVVFNTAKVFALFAFSLHKKVITTPNVLLRLL